MNASDAATSPALMSARKMRVAYSVDAQADLSSILTYTDQEWGELQRAAYEQTLRGAINTLARTPLLGRDRNELANGLRSYPIGSHVVYYWGLRDTLFVVRVMHHRQDPFREAWEHPSESEGTEAS